MSRVGYYPGCALKGTSREYDISIRKVNEQFDVELVEIDDWNCCGASSAHMTNYKLNIALNARNLVLAEEQGLKEVMAPCPLCSRVMIDVHQQLMTNKELQGEMNEVLEKEYHSGVTVINYLQFVEKYYLPVLKDKIKRKIEGLKVACYYGCLLTRPPEVVKFDDAEQPESMERILRELGLETVDWEFRTECCGGGFTLADAKLVTTLIRRILEDAKLHEAELIVVACPMCHANLDMRQITVKELFGISFDLPILYLSEIIGLSIGLRPDEVALGKHLIATESITNRIAPE